VDVCAAKSSVIRLIVPVHGVHSEDSFHQKLTQLLLAHPAARTLGVQLDSLGSWLETAEVRYFDPYGKLVSFPKRSFNDLTMWILRAEVGGADFGELGVHAVHASPELLPPDHDDSYSTIHQRSGARSIPDRARSMPDRTRSRAVDQTTESTLMDDGDEDSAHDSAASSDAEDEEDRLSAFLPLQPLCDQAGADVDAHEHVAKSAHAQARTHTQLEGESRQLKLQAEARLRQADVVATGRIRLEKAVDALVVRMDD